MGITYHRGDGTTTTEDDPAYEDQYFTVTETDTTYTAELTQFYSKNGEFKMTATKEVKFTREMFIAMFVAAINVS
jgi:hypothetical protein